MRFDYQARTSKGEVQSGTVEASSREAAVDILQKHKLIVTNLYSVGESSGFAGKIEIPAFFNRINLRDVSVFSRQLAILFTSEVPLVESLRTLSDQTENTGFKEKIIKISDDVDSGTSFSKSIAKYPEIFSTFYVSMIRAGEVSGKLSESLLYLSEHYEREYDLMSKVKGAMYYPAFVLSALLITMTIMLVFVIPALTSILKESGQKLPIVTQAIISMVDFIRTKGWILLILIGVGVGFILRWKNTPNGKKGWDKYILKAPIFGKIFKEICLSRFSENLSTLIKGGLPISKAMEVSADVVGNEMYKEVILEAEAGIRRGEFMSAIFKTKREIIPPLVTQMILIGEKTGRLPSVLENLSKFYQKEVARMTENLVSLVEPLLILILGFGVGFIVVGVLMPIYQMAGSIF